MGVEGLPDYCQMGMGVQDSFLVSVVDTWGTDCVMAELSTNPPLPPSTILSWLEEVRVPCYYSSCGFH